MSDRERWIVYPLLFLALGAALRDKLAKRSVAEHVICQELSVIDDQGRRVALLQGGNLVLNRVDAQEIYASNLRPPTASNQQGGLNLMQMLNLLQRAGANVRVTPGPSPGAPSPATPSPGNASPNTPAPAESAEEGPSELGSSEPEPPGEEPPPAVEP